MFFLKDYIGLFLQILLVIAAILLFSYLDPFNIFNTKKLRLNTTSLLVSSTKGIGELITAEYYGEVLATSQESYEITFKDLYDSLANQMKGVHANFLNVVDTLKNRNDRWGKRYDYLLQQHPEITEHPQFPDYWNLMKKITNEKKDKRVLEQLIKNEKLNDFNDQGVSEYLEEEYGLSNKEEKMIRKQQLVMLGRGWVKAGIDFSKFDETHFNYNQSTGKIYLFRKRPSIISASINPWLSPGHKIKGFEMLDVNRKANDPELVKEVKRLCLGKLKKQAMEAGIMEKAVQYAEENLTAFFSLLLDKNVTVNIFGHPLQAYLREYVEDGKLSETELQSADSLIEKYYMEEPRYVIEFYEALNSARITTQLNDTLPWNYLSLYITISYDSIHDAYEKELVKSLKAEPDSIDYFYYLMQEWKGENKLQKVAELEQNWKEYSIDSLQKYNRSNIGPIKFSDITFLLQTDSSFQNNVKKYREKNIAKLRQQIDSLKSEIDSVIVKSNNAPDTSGNNVN